MPVPHPLKAVSAAALLGLCGLAQADNSKVTISGWLDLGISKKTETPTQVGTLGRSNLAVSGVEDLGDSFSAIFKLSTRFDMDTGTVEASDAVRPFWKDEATVGLKGKFGAVRAGHALTPLWQYAWAYDPWYNFDRIASQQWWQFAPDYLSDPANKDYSRVNDTVFYDSPTVGGFAAHVSATVDKADTDLTRNVSASFNYDNEALSLMIGLERNSQKDKVGFVGASYKFGALQLMGSYSYVKLNPDGTIYGADWTNWIGASEQHTKRTSFSVGAAYTAGFNTFKFGLGRDQQGSTSGFNYIGSKFTQAGTGFSGPINMGSLGYVYTLSKRTSLLADFAYSKWKYSDDNGHTSATGYALGITHSF